MTDDSDGSDTRLTRRGYLGVLGATSAAVLAGATDVGSATGHGYGASGYGAGQYGGDVTVTDPVLEVSTVGTDAVDTTSATLVGDLTELSNADSASVYFEWGTGSDGLPEATSEQTVGATGGFEATVADLQADTEYAFRAVATAGDTVAAGTERTLRTDSAADPEPTQGTPEIVTLTGADVSNPKNPHVDAELHWETTIDASELYAAELTLSDHEGLIDSWSYDLSGETAAAAETSRIPHRAGEQDVDYTATLVVYSYYGNTDTQTTTFKAQ
jgi:hypothetical protein